jgi:hypothetical protein
MKSIIAITLLSIASISSVMADAQSKQVCTSKPSLTSGFTSVTLTIQNEYVATLTGSQSGGEAKFMRPIGPFNVKISHEADEIVYSNKEQDISLNIITTSFNGHLITTASYSDSSDDSLTMHCQAE